MKVLFVCLGNICRSPLAEAIFNHKIKLLKLEKEWDADSCGTSNYHIGEPPDPRTIRCAHQNKVEMEHRGRQLAESDFSAYDRIIAMDSSNRQGILRLKNAATSSATVHMMRDFDPEGKGDVPDPYYGGEREFQEVFDMLDRSIDGLIADMSVTDSSKT